MIYNNAMAGDDELEKRAIEELLRETDRARVRAETMGPAGWLKCPLRTTNKRFLLNTLRSTGLQRRTDEPRRGHSTTRGRMRRDSPDRSRDRSRTPHREQRSPRDTEQKHQHGEQKQRSRTGQRQRREQTQRHKTPETQGKDRRTQRQTQT